MLHCHSFYYYTLLLCRRSSFYYILQPHFGLILLLLVQQSLQDSSQVGGVGVSFACGNSLSSSSSSSSNNNNPSSATLSQYQLIGIDVLIKNVCSPLSNEPTSAYLPGTGYLIARCEECSKCPQELLHLYRALTQLAVNAKLQSLIIVVDKELERLRPQSSRSTPGNTPLVKFIFSTTSDDDGGLLSLCDPSNDANDNESLKSFSKTSVLFVSISFIILIVISLAWLVFYYVQRFRYAHAKDRLQRRLFNAAKRVLAKIPTRPVKSGDIELKSDCPVCIDPYKPGDICRQLPCRHIFHKSCVDPWLLEHRTCPMCKSDILKAFGINVNRSRAAQFSAASVDDDIESNGGRGGNGGVGGREGRGINNLTNNEVDRLSLESTSSDSANPFPVVTEVHDPFGFSPSTSPQFIQTFQNNSVPIKTTIIPKSSSSSLHCEIIQTQIERHEQVEENLNDLIPSTSSSNTNFDENNKNLKKLSKINEKDEEEDEVKNEKLKEEKILNGQKRGKNNNNNNGGSAPLRLFRAVTGRSKNNVNTAIVRLSRSRSLSHHYPTEIEKNTNNGNGQPFIFYSLKGDNLRKIKKDLSFDNNSIQTKSTFLSSSPQSQTETSTSSTSSSSKIFPSLTENNDKDKNNSSFRALTAPGDFRRKKGGGGSFNNGERLKTSGGIKILKIKNKNVNNGQNNLKQHSLSDGDLKEDKK